MNARFNLVLTAAALMTVTTGLAFAGGELPGFYQEPGLSPNRTTVNHHNDEHIDPFTGMLQLHHNDATLPGNGGFDLALQRSYNTPPKWYGTFSDPTSYNRTPNIGVGWNLLIGGRAFGADTACGGAGQFTFETPDGARQGLLRLPDGTFLSPSRWKGVCVLGGVQVFSPNGTRYDLTQAIAEALPNTIQTAPFHYPTRIEDRNGNYATFTYATAGAVTLLDNVQTSDGRIIRFTYTRTGAVDLLSMVSVGNRNWQYIYFPTPALVDGGGQGTAYFLERVIPPSGAPWRYKYGTCGNGCLLAEVHYPEGGDVAYSYGTVDFNDGAGDTIVVIGKSIGGALSLGTSLNTTFAYTPGTLGANATTTVTNDIGSTVYEHVGQATVTMGSTWQIGLLVKRTVKSASNSELQRETYTWDKQQISPYPTIRMGGLNDGVTYAPLLAQKVVRRDGRDYSTTYSNFDQYGNAQTLSEVGERSRTTTRTFFTDASKWILNIPANETITGLGNITRTFDAKGNMLGENRFGVVTGFTYDANGSLSSRTDARNFTTHFSSYQRGVAQREERPEGVVIDRVVDDAGNVVSQTDGAGNLYGYDYDGVRRMTRKAPPIGAPTTIAWTGNARKMVTRGTLIEELVIDGIGNPYLEKRDGTATAYTYDALSRPIFESLPGAVTENADGSISASGTSFPRDALGRVARITNSDGSQRFLNHAPGVVYETNEIGNPTDRQYVAFGDPDKKFLTNTTEGLSVTTIGRNDLGQATSVAKDGKSRTYGYNGSFQLTSVTDPEIGTTTFGRDAVGNMTSRTIGGRITTFGYDGLNRLTSISYPSGTGNVAVIYLGNGRTSSVVNPTASRTYTYDANANLRTDTLTVGGQSFVITYTYDQNDALATLTYPATGEVITFAPDNQGRPTKALPFITAVTYFASGNTKEITYANGTKMSLEESIRQWPQGFRAGKTDGLTAEFLSKQYRYDKTGNVLQFYDVADPSQSLQMTYDGINELTSVLGPWGLWNIVYDRGGNITRYGIAAGEDPYFYGADNKLASVGSRSFAYDVYGNVTSDGRHTYQYDDASNLICVDCGTSSQITYGYDGNNRRVSRTKGSETTHFVYATNGELLLEYNAQTRKATEHVLSQRETNRKQASAALTDR